MIERRSRRDFLRLCSAGTVACGVPTACANDSISSVGPASFGDVTAGTVTQFPEGTLTQVGTMPVFLGRDSGGFYALTSTCTHAGCTVGTEVSGSTAYLLCPCHGSLYDRNGAVVHGPAEAPLVHFAVEVDSGNVIIHGGTQVDAATRTRAS